MFVPEPSHMPEKQNNDIKHEEINTIIKHEEKWEIATDIQPQILHWKSFLI